MSYEQYAEIQTRYIEDVRTVLPNVLDWWYAQAQSDASNIRTADTANSFEKRWPAGPGSHPRILAVFRQYFLEVDDLNLEHEAQPEKPAPPHEDLWGVDELEEGRPFVRPVDLLINDIEALDPELFGVLQGIVFIPVGSTPDEGLV